MALTLGQTMAAKYKTVLSSASIVTLKEKFSQVGQMYIYILFLAQGEKQNKNFLLSL